MVKKDYPELEGEKVQYPETSQVGVVALCNYDIGISVVSEDDSKDHLVCIPGPNSPNAANEHRPQGYGNLFQIAAGMLKNGKFDNATYEAACEKERGVQFGFRMVDCPTGI